MVEDPSSQPFVTSVGGTSFGTFDPGTNPSGFEAVWNGLDQCVASNLAVCANGGGVSSVWPMPSYQHGTRVITSLSQKGPFCSLTTAGQYCRKVPGVSANADEYTPYAEYCTGAPTTTSTCAQFSGGLPPAG